MALTLDKGKARQGGSAPAKAAPKMPIPFARAARMKKNLSFSIGPVSLGAGAQPFGPIQIPANGYLRALNLDVTVTVADNDAAVVAFEPDAPYNLFQQISVVTSSGDSLIVSMSGYSLAQAIKFGAFGQETPYCDPAHFGGAAMVTGDGATGGSFSFRLRVPFEIDASSGFCSLPNMAANRSYNLQGLFNSLAAIYTVAPDGTAPVVNVKGTAEYWSVPNDTNAQGDVQQTAPVGNGSFHALQVQTIPINAGSGIYQLTNVGNVIRQIIFIYRDSDGVRSTLANWPDVSEILLNNDQLFYLTKNDWTNDLNNNGWIGQPSLPATASDGELDSGVFPLIQFAAPGETVTMHDGPRNQYLPTLDATLLQIRGTAWGEAGTLEVITSSIVPKSADALYAPHVW